MQLSPERLSNLPKVTQLESMVCLFFYLAMLHLCCSAQTLQLRCTGCTACGLSSCGAQV